MDIHAHPFQLCPPAQIGQVHHEGAADHLGRTIQAAADERVSVQLTEHDGQDAVVISRTEGTR